MSKIGRNDLYPCGSGKKYKKCCMMKYFDDTYDKGLIGDAWTD